MRCLAALVTLTVALTACGSEADKLSSSERDEVETFCTLYMGIDEYDNPDGFDRCVEDAAPVVECLAGARVATAGAFIPSECDGEEPVR